MSAGDLFAFLFWRVAPWPKDDPRGFGPRKECVCYCGDVPDLILTRRDATWFVCYGCAPPFGWALVWPSRKAKRRDRLNHPVPAAAVSSTQEPGNG